jgi:hypothetical protein
MPGRVLGYARPNPIRRPLWHRITWFVLFCCVAGLYMTIAGSVVWFVLTSYYGD